MLITGLFFPSHGFTPAIGVGIILHALAPQQTEPVFVQAQLSVLALFLVLEQSRSAGSIRNEICRRLTKRSIALLHAEPELAALLRSRSS